MITEHNCENCVELIRYIVLEKKGYGRIKGISVKNNTIIVR